MSWTDLGQIIPEIEYIDIQVSNYNVNIDDDVTITVTVTDQNDEPIGNKTYTLKHNDTELTTITTNANGIGTTTYNCDEWGIHNFSVKNNKIQINVTGWKQVVNQASGKIQVYTDGETVQFSFQGSQAINANGATNLGTIPSQYAPRNDKTSPTHYQVHNINMVLDGTGAIIVHNATSTTSMIIRVLFTYALKSKIIS